MRYLFLTDCFIVMNLHRTECTVNTSTCENGYARVAEFEVYGTTANVGMQNAALQVRELMFLSRTMNHVPLFSFVSFHIRSLYDLRHKVVLISLNYFFGLSSYSSENSRGM